MNLFLNPSLNELNKMIDETDLNEEVNIVVDYDGEVLVDPEAKMPGLNLDRFKFRFILKSMHRDVKRRSLLVRTLFRKLKNAWETDDMNNSLLA